MFKLLSAIFLFLIAPVAAKAAVTPVDIRINEDYLLTDTAPYIDNGTVFAPIRAVSEAFDADVDWNKETAYAHIYHDNMEIKMSANSDKIFVNGIKQDTGKTLQLKNDRIMVPVRILSNLLNADVEWDDTYKNVEITADGITLSDSEKDHSYTHDELFWLSRIIHAESRGESLEGKIAVGDVVLNRVKSPLFPNTIYGVIFDKKHGIQFEPTLNGAIYNSPGTESICAAKIAFKSKASSIGECLYFFAPKLISGTWIEKNRVFYKTIGNHDFYL